MPNEQDFTKLFNTIDALLSKTDLNDVSEESSGFEQVPDGYYLCEVVKSELKESKSSHQPMVSFQFKITENGYTADVTDDDVKLTEVPHTKGRSLFINYVLKDERSVKRFVADMLKFEGETPGESLLPKEAFISSETMVDAIDILKGMRIYAVVATTTNGDTTSTWTNLISWKRASALSLPID